MFIFAIIFLVASIIVGIFDVKKRKLVGFNKIKTVLIYLYFGIAMSLFVSFITINSWVSMFIFLHLVLIFCIVALKHKKSLFVAYDLIILSIIGMILYVYQNTLLYIILGIGIYLLPALCYIDRRNYYIVKKIERCTEEVEAKIIKVYKGRTGFHIVYVPKFEFSLNGKIYKFMDSTEIYFTNKEQCKVGDIIKLFVNPNPKIDSPNGCNDVFLPNTYREYSLSFGIALFYISTLAIFALIVFLNFMN